MLTKKLLDFAGNMLQRSYTYYAIGKDIYEYSSQSIRRHLSALESEEPHTPTLQEDAEESTIEMKRENLKKNLEIPEADDSFVHSKQQSLKASQGVSDHSGSSYHGPGKPGDKTNSNMWQRNFENHQGN